MREAEEIGDVDWSFDDIVLAVVLFGYAVQWLWQV